ncbi:hypothetical protein M4D58_26235 [Brevibacillus borstelensis]|uniref:hypothetical protein n=1 Tax=Brevibacillus borstelensis TaxID=45462 RepID=UPI00203E2E38|nr:hypothetical protein [Brevibacillus borstelensis]MCM3594052.1 hypothetical protein [Brevibacillus borstelensis]
MGNLIIEPGKGIGLIKLGMNKDEVEKCIQKYTEKYIRRNIIFRTISRASSWWNMILKVRLTL